ncbi:MAG TPA: D-alanyl-D-alanine carboxypeptidase, partial [Ferruginibacter sp.]|nr:D-alanyl-D-alanine carboxypeptidase [Ferruginibacter sp.]
MRTVAILAFSLICNISVAQDIKQKISAALTKMRADSQFVHSIISLYITDESGTVIYANNERIGLAPASCQKIITSVSAFELLGKDFRYRTSIWYKGRVEKGILNGVIHIKGSGDPSTGSWRYTAFKQNDFLSAFGAFINKAGIKKVTSSPVLSNENFSSQVI